MVSGYALTFGLAMVRTPRSSSWPGWSRGWRPAFTIRRSARPSSACSPAAAGPLLGGVLIQTTGMQNGWRWVFLVNLFLGMVEVPVAIKLLPRRQEPEEHGLDPIGKNERKRRDRGSGPP
ncbi:MAG TPA: hypothetical protein VFB06_30570 [Streptosporangiaceae bacterium]|nr:hypothetical protein [Streptosporangiaceae bacterium]